VIREYYPEHDTKHMTSSHPWHNNIYIPNNGLRLAYLTRAKRVAGRPQSAPDLSSQDNFLNQELRDGLNIVGELPYSTTLEDEHDPSRGLKKPCTGQYSPAHR